MLLTEKQINGHKFNTFLDRSKNHLQCKNGISNVYQPKQKIFQTFSLLEYTKLINSPVTTENYPYVLLIPNP